MNKRSFAVSLALHSLLALLLVHGKGKGSTAGQEANGDDSGENAKQRKVDVLPRPEHSTMLVELIGPGNAVKPTATKHDCKGDASFGGIGISVIGNTVWKVYPGYPADKAGIKEGDRVTPGIGEIRGEVGTPIILIVVRGSTILTKTIIREKICAEEIISKGR